MTDMKHQLHAVQLRQLLDGKIVWLQQALETMAKGRVRRPNECLKQIRTYQMLVASTEKSTPRNRSGKGVPALNELRFALEQIQQPQSALKVLTKLQTEENEDAIDWVTGRLKHRSSEQTESVVNSAHKALKDLSADHHRDTLNLLTDATLRRLQTHHLSRQVRELVQQLKHVSKEGVTPDQLVGLRESLRCCRFQLELAGQLFETPLPFDARLLDECNDKLKKTAQWQTLWRLLNELEPEFNSRPRTMGHEWTSLMEDVQIGSQKRLRKLARSIHRDNSHWAGLRFALSRLKSEKKAGTPAD